MKFLLGIQTVLTGLRQEGKALASQRPSAFFGKVKGGHVAVWHFRGVRFMGTKDAGRKIFDQMCLTTERKLTCSS